MASSNQTRSNNDRGRTAETPSEIPAAGWKDILLRVKEQISEDRVSLVAAGTTFYLLLALFPAIAAMVSIYGLFADASTIGDHLNSMKGVVPDSVIDIVGTQVKSLTSQGDKSLGFAFVIGLVLALWSTNSGVKSMFEAMNIAYNEREKRSFVMLNLQSLIFTVGGVIFAGVFVFLVGILPAIIEMVGFGDAAQTAVAIIRWPVLLAVVLLAIALLYRYGPSRDHPEWRWVTWGSVVTAVIWLLASVLFSWYVKNFANYNATYGSLGAVIGLLMWTWVSVFVLIVGGELNSEIEHQTEHDTTVGMARPMGQRGAVMADTLGSTGSGAGKGDDYDESGWSDEGQGEGGRRGGQGKGKGLDLSWAPLALGAAGAVLAFDLLLPSIRRAGRSTRSELGHQSANLLRQAGLMKPAPAPEPPPPPTLREQMQRVRNSRRLKRIRNSRQVRRAEAELHSWVDEAANQARIVRRKGLIAWLKRIFSR